jgi:hypothetical protein
VVGEIKLREPYGFPIGLQYVGQAFDTQAGRVVTNTGILSATPAGPPDPDNLFAAKLSYSSWDSGAMFGSLEGFDGELCPRWPWPWPRRPRLDFRISSYEIDEPGFSRATPLELGLLLPFSSASRVASYFGAGLGYYLINGTSAAARDEIGGYAALGMDIHVADRWGFTTWKVPTARWEAAWTSKVPSSKRASVSASEGSGSATAPCKSSRCRCRCNPGPGTRSPGAAELEGSRRAGRDPRPEASKASRRKWTGRGRWWSRNSPQGFQGLKGHRRPAAGDVLCPFRPDLKSHWAGQPWAQALHRAACWSLQATPNWRIC